MAFYAKSFIYDSIPSLNYGLSISTLSDSDSNHMGANVELLTQNVYRKPKVYLLGVQQTPVMTIPITITVSEELDASEASAVSRWLFGQMSYKKLQILQPDMQYIYFNCIFTEPEVLRVGNVIRGYNSNIICDSPFAWEYANNIIYRFSEENYSITKKITINNTSENSDYTYPIIKFKINKFGGSISAKNASDNYRNFAFTGLSPDEEITVDNDLQIITSSTGLNRLPNFTYYKWFRFKPKANSIILTGNISYFSYTNQIARKIS